MTRNLAGTLREAVAGSGPVRFYLFPDSETSWLENSIDTRSHVRLKDQQQMWFDI